MRIQLLPAFFCVAITAYAAAPPKACTLLTQQQAAAIFGAPVKAPLDVTMACIFSPVTPTPEANVNMNIVAMDGAPAGTMAKAYVQSMHKDYATDKVESVPGLGEQNREIISDHKITILKSDMIQAVKQALTKF
jgi:hypothetical protein